MTQVFSPVRVAFFRDELTRMMETLSVTQLDAPTEFRRGYLTALAHLAHMCALDAERVQTFTLTARALEVRP